MCGDALRAAAELVDYFPRFNAERRAAGKRTLDFGVALHLGEVLYGNIGASERLDFTVVGSAVNEASRIEGMCRPLQRKVLVSASFHEGRRGKREQDDLPRVPCASRHPRTAGAVHDCRRLGGPVGAVGCGARITSRTARRTWC